VIVYLSPFDISREDALNLWARAVTAPLTPPPFIAATEMALALWLERDPKWTQQACAELMWILGVRIRESIGSLAMAWKVIDQEGRGEEEGEQDDAEESDVTGVREEDEDGSDDMPGLIWTPLWNASVAQRAQSAWTRRFGQIGWRTPEETISDLRAVVWLAIMNCQDVHWPDALGVESRRAAQRATRAEQAS
jgi:hypothetical protein